MQLRYYKQSDISDVLLRKISDFCIKESPGITKDYLKSRLPLWLGIYIVIDTDLEVIGFNPIITKVLRLGSQKRLFASPAYIFDKTIRGHGVVEKLFFGSFLKVTQAYPFEPIWLFSLCGNYKSYKVLHRNHPDVLPRPGHELLGRDLEWARLAAKELYNIELTNGIAKNPKSRVLDGQRLLSQEKLISDDLAKFFTATNPEYCNGDALACITPVKVVNFLFSPIRHIKYKKLIRS